MKLEKRSSGEAEETPLPQEESHSKKPVVVYIMILFIVAFLLMALSFLMHQRSNTEALGKLQSSVSAMQEVQAAQDKVIQLQEELDDAKDHVADLESSPPETMMPALPPCSGWRTRTSLPACPRKALR